MTNHTLEEIVAVEHEIQARLAEEQRQAAQWLAAERDTIARATEAELAEARHQCRQQITAAEAEAGDEGGELIPRAEAYAARLQNLPEESLQVQVSGHLQRLLPERP
jgi:F0F1-type ATP synthase membrane subunit b/b'